jgi:hypothetical protein
MWCFVVLTGLCGERVLVYKYIGASYCDHRAYVGSVL